jgi:predicted DNA-binding WGR domain protein
MAKRRRTAKNKSTSAKEVVGSLSVSGKDAPGSRGDYQSPSYPYVSKEPEIVEPKMKHYDSMRKDAGAGIVKFFKITAVRDNNNVCMLKIKSGKLGHRITSKDEGPFDDFTAACDKAQEMIKEKRKRGYRSK